MITKRLLSIAAFIPNIAEVLQNFDTLRWWKSRTGPNGSYEAITGDAALPAMLLSSRVEPYFVENTTLQIEQDGVVLYNAVFADPDPTPAAAAAAAVSFAGSIIGGVNAGRLTIASFTSGLGSSLELKTPDIAQRLGFLSTSAIGTGEDTPLVPGQHEYILNDPNSDTAFWYKTQYINSSTLVTSPLSAPISADQVRAIDDAQMIWAYVRLASLTGRPDRNRRIVLANFRFPNTDLTGIVGISKLYEEMTTDVDGYARIRVIRGSTFDINVVGTGLTRRITAPLVGDGFNILDPSLVVDDEYGIHEQGVDFAIRTT